MKLILSLLICVKCWNCAQADFCAYNFSINDLESSVIEEVLSFITKGVLICTDRKIDSNLINFYLYTNSSKAGTKLNTLAPVMDVNKTIVLIPGWLCNISNDLMPELKEAYLQKYDDANVIIVDWAYYAARTYGDAYCRLPNVAKAVAEFLVRLETNLGITVGSMHLVGHSMGGQIAGITGSNLRTIYGKLVKRITGLDPAGPLFLGNPESGRLDKTDASFVDVIHTNAGFLGYKPRCGHADYYPGCGTFQTGCPFNILNVLSIDLFINKFGCDHLRSVDYMIESINSNKFRSESKWLCFGDSSEISYMGEYSILSYKDDSYICDTNPTRPFALG